MNRNFNIEQLYEEMTLNKSDGTSQCIFTRCPVCESVEIYIQDNGKVLCAECDSMFWPWNVRLEEAEEVDQ